MALPVTDQRTLAHPQKMLQRFTLLCGLTWIFVAGVANAQYELAELPFFESPQGTFGIGGALRIYDDLYIGKEDNLVDYDVVPLYLYNGRYLFSRGTTAGLHVINTDKFELNGLVRWRFQRLDPTQREGFEGVNERKQTLDGGIELRVKSKLGQLNLNYLTDVLDRHKGQSAEIAYFLEFNRGNMTLSPFVGWAWNSSELVNYYYGVSEDEAAEGRPAYMAGDAQRLSLGLNTSWRVGQRGTWFVNVGLGGVDSAIADSPLVDSDTGPVIFAGGSYALANLTNPGDDLPSERRGEWSWRMSYGFQAGGNLIGDIDQGEVGRSKFAQTNMGGVTFAKLFRGGERADIHGKLAVFRHFEEDDGNGDFFSYAAYVSITGKGYSSWSQKELFRYGLGYGLSYAETIPIHEQRKQGAQDDNASRFMTYLELQLDFPLRNLFKQSNALRNCYTGVTVTHRSGIWGSADAFNSVNGGSNWIAAHFECRVGL